MLYLAELSLPGLSTPKVETAVAKFNEYKSVGSDQIPAKLLPVGGKVSQSVIYGSINSI
jgi:hypothetical protein